eukprot:CAMPEP_0116125016 /NCGR_PEP_ID=MMETSP0329-20121206/5587_1 /TAXON_ID=697910 /ORGANISM="Pseudo-nitzschia arenysensis, Strain B593" /LENGTH=390 /DNA_ID=CAMNT_0003619031 /DNA_START=57 /DNA_END=1229 /DNA_ORIENTATION=+
MDAIVQLIRNALCCIKDLEIFSDTLLYDPSKTKELLMGVFSVELPEIVDKTTPLEVIISITQLYACLSCTKSGCMLAWNSAGKLKRIVRLLESRLSQTAPADNSKHATTANRIVNESLVKEAKSAMRNVFVGILVAPIGIAFFWLFANSWHITETGWIGGIVALIDALTVMEICLIPLLYYMIVDGFAQLKKVQETKEVMETVTTEKGFGPDYLNITRYEYMEPGWVPFFEEGLSPMGGASTDSETKQLEAETKQVQQTLGLWFAPAKDDGEKDAKIRKEALGNALGTMKKSLFGFSTKGYREFLYFLLNFVAFYGYLMGIITFYYPDDEFQPSWVSQLKLGTDNAFADWTGNFAGDLMWTIEPAVILASPYYIASMAPTIKVPAKSKTD